MHHEVDGQTPTPEEFYVLAKGIVGSVSYLTIPGANVAHDQGANHATIWEEYLQLKRLVDPVKKEFKSVWKFKGKQAFVVWEEIVNLMVFKR